MTEQCRALFKYKNEEKSVEIIDLQIFNSLKWDGVYKRGHLGLYHIRLYSSKVEQIFFQPSINIFTLEGKIGYIQIPQNSICMAGCAHMSHEKVHKDFLQSVQKFT